MCRKNSSSASNPPADAPIPTMGKPSGSGRLAVGPAFLARVTARSAVVDRTRSVLVGIVGTVPRLDDFRLATAPIRFTFDLWRPTVLRSSPHCRRRQDGFIQFVAGRIFGDEQCRTRRFHGGFDLTCAVNGKPDHGDGGMVL